jgi:tetratricopeptide (TPR) repeat protein
VGLAVFYPYLGSSPPIWKVVAATLTLAGISTAALVWRRRFPYLFVGWFWYVGMLVPVIGLVQVGSHSMADRYTYLPQIGLCIVVTWAVVQLAVSRRHLHRVCGIAAALVVLVLMGIAWRQTSYWHDSETLWTRDLACAADSDIAHSKLGYALAVRGEVDAAIAHYQKSLEIKPNDVKALYNLGIVLAKIGQVDAAIAHYQKALEIQPDYPAAHDGIGIALARRGEIDAAIAHFRKALEIQPDYPGARHNLGLALQQRGQHDRVGRPRARP